MGKLLLLFTVVPLLELYLLVKLSAVMGLASTIALVLLTGFAGAALARAEGLRVLRAWQSALEAGRVPEDGVVGGLLVLIGGVLLVTPGVLTDAFGLLLLLPPTRRALARILTERVRRGIARGDVQVVSFGFRPTPGAGPFRPGRPVGGPRADGYRVQDAVEVEARVTDVRDA